MKQLSLLDLPAGPKRDPEGPSFWWALRYKAMYAQAVADFVLMYAVKPIFHLARAKHQIFLADPAQAIIVEKMTGALAETGKRALWVRRSGNWIIEPPRHSARKTSLPKLRRYSLDPRAERHGIPWLWPRSRLRLRRSKPFLPSSGPWMFFGNTGQRFRTVTCSACLASLACLRRCATQRSLSALLSGRVADFED